MIDVIDSNTEELYFRVCEAREADMGRAITAARNAFGAADIFDSSTYERGDGATVPNFRAYAARVAHRDLSASFAKWLDPPGKVS
jgi:hypothetical protein